MEPTCSEQFLFTVGVSGGPVFSIKLLLQCEAHTLHLQIYSHKNKLPLSHYKGASRKQLKSQIIPRIFQLRLLNVLRSSELFAQKDKPGTRMHLHHSPRVPLRWNMAST